MANDEPSVSATSTSTTVATGSSAHGRVRTDGAPATTAAAAALSSRGPLRERDRDDGPDTDGVRGGGLRLSAAARPLPPPRRDDDDDDNDDDDDDDDSDEEEEAAAPSAPSFLVFLPGFMRRHLVARLTTPPAPSADGGPSATPVLPPPTFAPFQPVGDTRFWTRTALIDLLIRTLVTIARAPPTAPPRCWSRLLPTLDAAAASSTAAAAAAAASTGGGGATMETLLEFYLAVHVGATGMGEAELARLKMDAVLGALHRRNGNGLL